MAHSRQAPQRHPIATVPRLARRTGLSEPTVHAALQRMAAIDLVRELTGKARHRVYSSAPYVAILSENTEPLPP